MTELWETVGIGVLVRCRWYWQRLYSSCNFTRRQAYRDQQTLWGRFIPQWCSVYFLSLQKSVLAPRFKKLFDAQRAGISQYASVSHSADRPLENSEISSAASPKWFLTMFDIVASHPTMFVMIRNSFGLVAEQFWTRFGRFCFFYVLGVHKNLG